MKNIYIITGANGFLGNNIVRILEKNKDNEIRALVLPNDLVNSLEGLNCKIYKGDVTKKDTLKKIFDVPNNSNVYVIHCAAIVYIKSKFSKSVYDVNVNGTKNIIDEVLKINAKLIYINSVHAIPDAKDGEVIKEITDFSPDKVIGEYAKTKAETAKYVMEMVKKKDLFACIIHPSGIIGPFDFAKGRLRACVKGGYDFVDVRDVANGIISACKKGKKGKCYILSNRYFEIKEILDIISDVGNIKKIKSILPMWFAKLSAPLSELYYSLLKQAPLYTSYSLYTLGTNSNFSNGFAKKELGYSNRDIKETIKDTLDWLKENNKI